MGGTDFKWGSRAPLAPPLATALILLSSALLSAVPEKQSPMIFMISQSIHIVFVYNSEDRYTTCLFLWFVLCSYFFSFERQAWFSIKNVS